MATYTLDIDTMKLGESATPLSGDGGFSKDSYGINLFKSRDDGAIYLAPSSTELGNGTMVKEFVASTYDTTNLGNDGGHHVDAGGNFYYLDGGTLTKVHTDSANTYQLGTTDILMYQNNTYATCQDDVVQTTGSSMSTLYSTWWSVTRGHGNLSTGYRHPLEVVEDTLYIADANNIHTWDNTTSVANAMTLPAGVNITSLRKHPDGRHLIAFCGRQQDFSHQYGGEGLIYIIDTINLEWINEIRIEAQVEGSILVAGAVFVTYGKNFGYFTGSGLERLRVLETSETTYSQSLGAMEDFVLLRDGRNVLAYGNLGAGNVFFNILRNSDTGSITTLLHIGNYELIYSYSQSGVGELRTIDFKNNGMNGRLITNPLPNTKRTWIRRVDIEHDNTSTTYTRFVLNVWHPDNTAFNLGNIEHAVTANNRRTRIQPNFLGAKSRVELQITNNPLPIYTLEVEYDGAEA